MADSSRGTPGPTSRLSRSQVLQAARRYYDLGETQSEIAKDLGLSQSYLARVLKNAKEKGWVRIYVDADRETELAAALMKKYPQLVHAEVVPTMPTPELTARALGTVAARWLDDLLDLDQEAEVRRIRRIAIGGSAVSREMVEQLARREESGISVAPTILTPSAGRIERFTAPMLATVLAFKLGALWPRTWEAVDERRSGYLYTATSDPPGDDATALAAWFQAFYARPEHQEVVRFWDEVDVAFVGAVRPDWLHRGAVERLASPGMAACKVAFGTAAGVVGGRCFRENGEEVPLADGVPSLEPCMPFRPIEVGSDGKPKRWVVADTWGAAAADLAGVVRRGLVNVVLIDHGGASKMLEHHL